LSAKGTLLNGKVVKQQELHHGDIIRLGGTELRFVHLALAEAETLLQQGEAPPVEPGAANAATLLGQQVGHFKLDAVIARGQTGVVFRVTDCRDGRELALKVLQPECTADEEDRQRFSRAMKTVVSLDHPNLVKVIMAGKSGPYCWLAMELVQGES